MLSGPAPGKKFIRDVRQRKRLGTGYRARVMDSRALARWREEVF